MRGEHPELGIGILIKAHLLADTFGIEAPAFRISAIATEAAKLRNVGKLLGQSNLEVMTGRTFVIADCLGLRLQHLIHVGKIDVVDAGPGTVFRRAVVEGDRSRLLAPGLDGTDLEGGLGQPPEICRSLGHDLSDVALGIGQVFLPTGFRVRIFVPLAGRDVGKELLQRPAETDPVLDLLHLAMDSRDLLQPDLVDLVGVEIGCGRISQPIGVVSRSLRQAPGPTIALALGLECVPSGQEVAVAALHRTGERLAGLCDEAILVGLRCFELGDLALEVGEYRRVGTRREWGTGEDALCVGANGSEVEARRYDAHARLQAHVGRNLAHHPLDLAKPGDIGLRVRNAGDPVLVNQEDGDGAGRTAVGARREAVPAPLERGDVLLDLFLEHAIAETPGGCQVRRIELRSKRSELALGKRQPSLPVRIGIVVQPVILLLAPEPRQRLRRARQLLFECRIEERQQALVLRPRIGNLRRGRRVGHSGRSGCYRLQGRRCGTGHGRKQNE